MVHQFKIIVEKTPDGYVAYPLGLKGIVVGQGDTYEEALSDVKSAIRFHIETFGKGNYTAYCHSEGVLHSPCHSEQSEESHRSGQAPRPKNLGGPSLRSG